MRTLVVVIGISLAVAAVAVRLRPAPAVDAAAATPAETAPAARAPQAPAAPAFDSGKAYEHLRQMVSIGPRPAGSVALRQTRAYITRQLAAAGLTVQEQPFTAQTPNGPVDMINLAVRLPGRRADRILFTGHYDTKLSKDFPFVGASDAASSAAFLIELARVLKDRPREFTYEFVWFDGEEATCWEWDQCSRPGAPDNTYGSRYYVQAAKKANAIPALKAMILVDMIGARDLKLQRDGYSAAWLNEILWAQAKKLGYASTFLDLDTKIEDDHLAFVDAGIPSVDLIDLNDYPQWHTKDDDLAHVAARSLQIVGDVVLAALPDIEKHLAR
jgi:hypothetical protein